ncbi:CATRA system-associated protein [Micromonospora sp. NPDC005173]|uniref:CATRA system-associated protein n=1 Tax=Micromonospora sp. NPDC005173 TaxID=3157165 RepID=UPI0033ABE015
MSDHPFPPDLMDDLRYVLNDMDAWQLDVVGWARVDTLLERVTAALLAGTADSLRDAVDALELSGPTRTKSADSGTTDRQPPKIRDKIVTLKDTLDSPKRSGATKSGGESRQSR